MKFLAIFLILKTICFASLGAVSDSDYLGCYQDKHYRILGGKSTNSKGMTVEKCKDICRNENNKFYGVQASTWCFCGNNLRHSVKKPEGECNYKCDGNKIQNCGGNMRMSMYKISNPEYLGCYQDKHYRILGGKSTNSKGMTVERCKDICQNENDKFYGVQASTWCFCGNTLRHSVKKPGECNYKCDGNKNQNCGGSWRMSMYKMSNPEYLGCYLDKHYRILGGKSTNSKGMTVEKCKGICQNENTQYYGLQASTWCFCGSAPRHSDKKPEGECNYKCDGNKNQNCGGSWRMSMYKIANLNYIGCYQDKHYRILGGKSTNSKGMTIEKCEDICRNENTQYYGVQASTWCFCGNNLRHSVKKPEGECNYKCDGNKKQNCGGNMRMSMFRHPDYLGCYLDKQYRILGGKSTNSKGMTVEKCKEICWDEYNQFYGLQASTWCFCGNTLRHSDRKPEGECNYKCDGNKNQNCGGSWRMSIYNNPDVDLLVCQ